MGRLTQRTASLTCLHAVILVCVAAGGGVRDDVEIVMSRVFDSAMNKTSHASSASLLPLLQPDGSFSDLHYGEDASDSFRTHGRRQGALAYRYLRGEDLADQVISCFSFITYDAPPNTDSNWWGHVIGTPDYMWEGAVLARDILPPDLLIAFLDRYWVNTQAGPVWDAGDHTGKMAGGNLAMRAMLAEVEGLLRGTYLQVHQLVSEALHRELALRQPWNEEGLRPDGCLNQHNQKGNHTTENGYLDHTLWNIYNGHYGKEMLRYDARLMSWYTGTDLDFDDDTVEGIFAAFLECEQWLFRGSTFEPTTLGRFITNGYEVTSAATEGGVEETGSLLLELGRHQQEVQAVLHRYSHPIPDPAYALSGHKYFFNSDLTVHQRRDFMASVRILSNRTVRPETWLDGSNINGYFQGDGFMTVLVDSEEYGSKNQEVFLVYDWAKVPGVTNLYTTDIPQYRLEVSYAERFFNNATFAGGVTDGRVGLTTMVYDRPHVSLNWLKSWFFFEDVVVVVGSALTLTPEDATGESVITTLTQVGFAGEYVIGREDGGMETFLQGQHQEDAPAWLFHRSVGYVFLEDHYSLLTSAETRTNKNVNINIFTAWLDHGPAPAQDTLAYAVLPAADLNRTKAFAADPDVEIMSQTSDLHVVCHHPSKTVGAALVSGGGATIASCGDVGPLELRVDIPCLVLVTITSHTADGVTAQVTLADPQQKYDLVTFQMVVDGRQVEETVQLPLPPLRGSSITVSLTF
ncbi:chondroitinase-AC [Procambarus clarkii]|uniref:chondroitinase-AC n=1 Tax=Procambarus clarkii TaxID=6728 RepID=UPI003743320F